MTAQYVRACFHCAAPVDCDLGYPPDARVYCGVCILTYGNGGSKVAVIALMSLDDRIIHKPGNEHGKAKCGDEMRDPWTAGAYLLLLDKATDLCERCYEL